MGPGGQWKKEGRRRCWPRGESWVGRETGLRGGGGVSWACRQKGREGRGLGFLSFFQNLFKFEIIFKLFLKFSNHFKNFKNFTPSYINSMQTK
jgi:hypothetical protein